MTPLGWVVRTQAGYGTPTPGQIEVVLVGFGANLAAKVKGYRRVWAVVKPLEPLVFFPKPVQTRACEVI